MRGQKWGAKLVGTGVPYADALWASRTISQTATKVQDWLRMNPAVKDEEIKITLTVMIGQDRIVYDDLDATTLADPAPVFVPVPPPEEPESDMDRAYG